MKRNPLELEGVSVRKTSSNGGCISNIIFALGMISIIILLITSIWIDLDEAELDNRLKT